MMKNFLMLLAMTTSTISLAGCSGGAGLFGGGSAGAPSAQAGMMPAGSGVPKEKFDDTFAAFDRDADGLVPKAELEAGIVAQFRKDDLNGDGHLDATETRTVNDRLMADPGGSPIIDWNADGKVIVQEYASQWRTQFERADVNSDGIVDGEERAGRARARKAPPLPQPELGGYRGKSSLTPVP